MSTVKYYIPYLSFLDKKTRIQHLVKNLRWSFLRKCLRLKAVNYFRNKLHLRCWTEF